MKMKSSIAMLATMIAIALSLFGVACGISEAEEDSSSGEQHIHVLTGVEATDATCATEGNIAYYVCECGRLFLDADATTETTSDLVKIARLAHTYGNWNVTATATCEADGSREKICSVCNDKITEILPALGHDEIEHAGQAATCTESGWNAFVTCSRCAYTTYTAVSALGHDEIEHAGQAATCTESGWEAYVTCSRCAYTTYTAVPALGHDYNAVAEISATYYEKGIAAHYECTRTGCDELFVKDGETYKKTTTADLEIKKLSLIDSATAVATEPENHLHLEIGKVKKMTYGGLYNVDNRDAYYFYNEKAEGNAEARFVTFGTDTTKKVYETYVFDPQRVRSFSFEYKIVNACSDGVEDKPAVLYITQILGSDGSYDVLEFNPATDGAWGSYSYTLTDAQIEKFAGFIVKTGGLNGEILIANIEVDAISLVDGCKTAPEPEAVLKIEEGKTKKMAYGGLYSVNGKAAYYFHTDLLDGWSETRFITEGTNTKSKPDRVHYLFAPQTITSFSFEYKIRNISKTIITEDNANAPYFAQIICSDGTYYPLALEPEADGKWHTVTYDVPEARQALFSGFIIKLGRLKGEMLIADINAETVSMVEGCATAAEPEAVLKIEDGRVKQMSYGGLYTVDGKAAYYFHTGSSEGCAETRFVTEGTNTTKKIGGKYKYAPKTITSFSFEYKIRNISKTIITDDNANARYLVQIIGSDSKFYPLELNMIADGKWHTVTCEVAEAQQALFSGFIIKLGGLKGEMLIAGINAAVVE